MAKKNNKGEKSMEQYREESRRLNKTARVIALILVGVMIVFAVVSSVVFLF